MISISSPGCGWGSPSSHSLIKRAQVVCAQNATASGSSPFTCSTGAPTIFLYESYPAGVGFSEQLFRVHDELVAQAGEVIRGCPCAHGCPSCVGPIYESGPNAKLVARQLAERLLPPPN